jgi:uncharacterized protein
MTSALMAKSAYDPTACIQMAETFAYALVEGDSTGHDRFHLDRVRRMALRLAAEMAERLGGDRLGITSYLDTLVVEIAALLHDAMDSKFCDDSVGQRHRVRALLDGMPMHPHQREHVLAIISGLGFVHSLPRPSSSPQGEVSKAGSESTPIPLSPEGMAVQDADRLDALGAIGVARCFAYGGRKGQPLHDPALQPREQLTAQAYRHELQSSLNHFHEKLLKLRDRLHTPEGRRIAEKRHLYLQDFLTRFEAEWEGADV